MSGRRQFLRAGAGFAVASLLPLDLALPFSSFASTFGPGSLPPWEAGTLELHHIDTGRGNSTFVLAPDGTTFLIDAGEAHSAERTMAPARPNASRSAGEWIARYVRRQLMRAARDRLDRMLLTHLHGDHVGEVTATSPRSARGDYRLTGAASVAEAIDIDDMIDRGWPSYNYPVAPKDLSALNYIALAKSMAARGTKVQKARAGSAAQFSLRNAAAYPEFRARVLAVNGNVWAKNGDKAIPHFPPLGGLTAAVLPSENMCSVALRLQYGRFSYYCGGDLTCDTDYGRLPWHDIETPVAEATGAVSVAVANHHGYFDACGPSAVRLLKPRVWVLPSWHVSHPAMSVLANLFSEDLYTGPRDVFATGMTPAALLTTERFSGRLASTDGHVVIRIPRGGNAFTVYVVNAGDESGTVKARFGPFRA